MSPSVPSFLPILDLSLADDPAKRPALLAQLHDALFNIGFLYIKNHGIEEHVITELTDKLPALFDLPDHIKSSLSKLHSPHFLGYSGFAEETTLGKKDLREQFDYATELPVVYHERKSVTTTNGTYAPDQPDDSRDFSQLYWRLRGPNQWPPEELLPGFRKALTAYHDAVQELSYRFVHLVEEAFDIPIGTFDHFFQAPDARAVGSSTTTTTTTNTSASAKPPYLPPQHRIKLLKYPPSPASEDSAGGQGVGPHKDSSGWLTFLLQVGDRQTGAGLEVLGADGQTWIPATPVPGTFVVNFGNAFEAATEGAVRATVHRVVMAPAPAPASSPSSPSSPPPPPRYSVPFFQGLPLDMTASRIRSYIPESVRRLRGAARGGDGAYGSGGGGVGAAAVASSGADGGASGTGAVSAFLDPRWDALGESQLRKWIRSHEDVGRKWYGDEVADYYLS
ncbi:2og-fe oxygenase [Diplodia corticola]|uniref:2og-fe oxygenase n=1 Tax=Diplodia corticola TaxID=236234 RepID=A0A1J9QU63_9PEZI|nr:2og-fe oxygenase [Diplodia corticola]OJD31984.1 2og-fe oxygenase [Diplodia corticola]